jgi:hypothetical protein
MSQNYFKNIIYLRKSTNIGPEIAENSLIPMILDPRYKLDIIDTKN